MNTLIAIALVLLGAARTRRPRSTEPALLAPLRASEGPGQVTYVTADQVFLDRGNAEGLSKGGELQVTRAGKAIGACTVTAVTEHAATCIGKGLHAGDRIGVQRKPRAVLQPIAAVPDARELASRLDVVQSSPGALVDFEGGQGGGAAAATWLEVVFTHQTFANFVSSGGPYHLERVDARLNELRVWRSLTVSADVSALGWSRRPVQFGSPYRADFQLFIRRLELAWRDSGRFEGAVGRIWLRHAPGLTMIDGVQLGVRSSSGESQFGGFAGLLPNALTLAPTFTQWAAGAYATSRFYRGAGADAFWIQPELRLDFASRTGLGTRFELGAALHAWSGRSFDAHAQVQLGAGPFNAPGLVDFARLDLGVRPAESIRFQLGARYRGNVAGELLELGAPSPGARGLHGELTAMYDGASFGLGVVGTYARDIDSTLTQARVGPQLLVPHLLGRAGGLGLGYAEEVGWLSGRSAWLQLSFSAGWRFRGLARVSWFMQSPSADAPGIAGHELSGALALELHLTPWLWIRASLLGRQALDSPAPAQTDLPSSSPLRAGLNAAAQLGLQL